IFYFLALAPPPRPLLLAKYHGRNALCEELQRRPYVHQAELTSTHVLDTDNEAAVMLCCMNQLACCTLRCIQEFRFVGTSHIFVTSTCNLCLCQNQRVCDTEHMPLSLCPTAILPL
ncbi:hypothetical protein KUCAC02_001365, partial [Chaenocephalus aceratus]